MIDYKVSANKLEEQKLDAMERRAKEQKFNRMVGQIPLCLNVLLTFLSKQKAVRFIFRILSFAVRYIIETAARLEYWFGNDLWDWLLSFWN